MTVFPAILLNTSRTPKGLNPGLLLIDIKLYATKCSDDEQSLLFDIFVLHNFLTSSAIVLRRSDFLAPNHEEAIILRHPSFVLIAAFLSVFCQ